MKYASFLGCLGDLKKSMHYEKTCYYNPERLVNLYKNLTDCYICSK